GVDVRADADLQVGERHQHAAVADPHDVASPLVAAEAEREPAASVPGVKRTDGVVEEAAQAERMKVGRNGTRHAGTFGGKARKPTRSAAEGNPPGGSAGDRCGGIDRPPDLGDLVRRKAAQL